MILAKAAGGHAPAFSIDLSWQNAVFSLRTAAAAILALALAYWLELSDPQWATLTVYILAQPTVGAALAKGVWRAFGTVIGGSIGLLVVALFSQAPELLVTATVLLVGVSFYAGARLQNYASYGVLLGGYTILLVAYEGAMVPLSAWSIALDRVAEMLIGIACSSLASVVILPRYAGDALREAQADTFTALARYGAKALRLSTPPVVFARLRQEMVAKVVSFDALRSFALFETPELRVNEEYLRRTVSEFLVVLSIARGLFVRVEEFDDDRARDAYVRLRATLESMAAMIERIAANPTAWNDARRLRREILAARGALNSTVTDIEAMAGTAAFDPLAEALLILNRVNDLLHGLGMVVIAAAASQRNRNVSRATHRQERRDFGGRQEPWLVAIRAAVAMLLLSGMWMATGWNEGFTAVSGGAIMLFFGVNQDDPQTGARSYLVWSSLGVLIAYLAIVFVLPWLQGFGALAVVLLLLLFPAGLMAGTPRHAWAGIALGGWTVAEIGFGNNFRPDELAYVNNAVALVCGMIVCLAIVAAIPVTSYARRGQSWQYAIGTILPGVARGSIVARRGAREIVAALAALLPRLALDRTRDEDFFRGTLSMASSAVELGRLRDTTSDPDMPERARRDIESFLGHFADAMEGLAANSGGHRAELTEAASAIDRLRTSLAAQASQPGPAARSLLRAAASLRFLGDRFSIDRAYLEREFSED